MIALVAALEALVERACASENLAFACRRAHEMECGIFTVVVIRQIVIEHQTLDPLLLGAFCFLL